MQTDIVRLVLIGVAWLTRLRTVSVPTAAASVTIAQWY